MRRILIPWLVASTLFAGAALADVPSYSVIKEKSYLKFFAIQNGAPVEGKFDDFTADIKFDPEHLDQSSIHVEVATGSVSAADGDIVQNLKMPEWLSVAAFPKAVFACKKLTRMPNSDNYYAEGSLKLRDKTVPVMLNFQMEHFDASSAVAKGSITLHRKDFGVGQGEWAKDDVVKDEVRVEFRIAADKK
jgi:polyisoprenoid-binding protein YceI